MGWLWPHLRRLWAIAGTITVGLAINWLYGWLGNQSLPSLQHLADVLGLYRYWSTGLLMGLFTIFVLAQTAHSRREAQLPRHLTVVTSNEKAADEARSELTLPDKPSIAVLPFQN